MLAMQTIAFVILSSIVVNVQKFNQQRCLATTISDEK